MAAHSEVLGDHTQVKVPVAVVAHALPVQSPKSEGRYVVRQGVLRENLCRQLLHVLLVIDNADDHTFQEFVRLPRVRVWLRELTIRQRVVPVVKLCYVAPKVLDDGEFAARVDPFVAFGAKDQVVTDDKSVTTFHGMLDLLRRVGAQLPAFN